jgi:hypothetical protein
MKVLNSIASLGVTLEELYKAENKQVVVTLSDKPYEFDVQLKDNRDKVDCKISSFGANLWFRTPKGMNYEKYNSLASLQNAIVRAVKAKVDSEGDIEFKLSNEVFHI